MDKSSTAKNGHERLKNMYIELD